MKRCACVLDTRDNEGKLASTYWFRSEASDLTTERVHRNHVEGRNRIDTNDIENETMLSKVTK